MLAHVPNRLDRLPRSMSRVKEVLRSILHCHVDFVCCLSPCVLYENTCHLSTCTDEVLKSTMTVLPKNFNEMMFCDLQT